MLKKTNVLLLFFFSLFRTSFKITITTKMIREIDDEGGLCYGEEFTV